MSALAIMQDGTLIEVATVGNEGPIGHYSVGENVISPNKVIVQVPGSGYRITIDKLNRELNASPSFRQLMGSISLLSCSRFRKR